MAQKVTGTPMSFSQVWKGDLLAGLQIFLIALPLSLGISLASGVPPLAGVLTAIVGGLIVSRLSGSYVTITGPAAGLIVVILSSIESLGQGDAAAGYKYTLAAIVVTGLLQMAMGIFKVGKLTNIFPLSAVHGMLAAIGVTIFAKQFPVMLGVKPVSKSILGNLAEIPSIIMRANPDVALIGVLGLAILVGINLSKAKWLKRVPAPMVVAILGIMMAKAMDFSHEHTLSFANSTFAVGPSYLLQLPDQLFASLGHPDFGILGTGRFWGAVLSITIICSLESLLSTAAVDKLDHFKRKSNMNKDIFAIGFGNTICGFIGGLPMISEIVRSSANVNAGAKTSWSNFFHGLFLLAAVVLFPQLIRMVPLASLAAILVFTGYRLASPKEFVKTQKIGLDQLLIFTATLLSVLATDLLIGIGVGVLVKIALHLIRGVSPRDFVRLRFQVKEEEECTTVVVTSATVFANLLPLAELLERLDKGKRTIIDLREAPFIDHTTMELLHTAERDFAAVNGRLETLVHQSHVAYADHPLAARRFKTV